MLCGRQAIELFRKSIRCNLGVLTNIIFSTDAIRLLRRFKNLYEGTSPLMHYICSF